MMKETTSTAIVETNCKCWFPFRKAYEKRQERKLKTVDTAQTETYDPPQFDAFSDFRSVSVRQEDSLDSNAPENQQIAAERQKDTPVIYSGGALEWEAFEEAVARITEGRITEGRITEGRSDNATHAGSVRSDPLPQSTKADREEVWNFPSWFPSLGTKHLPPSEADAASTAHEDGSVFSGSLFDGVSVITMESRAQAYSASSLADFADSASLGLAVSVEEESLAGKSHRTSGSKSQRSTENKSQRSTENKSQRSTENKSQRSTENKSQRSTENKSQPTIDEIPLRPTTPDVASRSVTSTNKDEKVENPADYDLESLDAFAVEVQEEKKEEDDDDNSAKLLKSLMMSQNSWSTVSSRVDAGSVLKSLSYSFSRGSSGSSSSKAASAKLPAPPATGRSTAAEKIDAASNIYSHNNNSSSDVQISEPPVLTCDRQLALQTKLAAIQDAAAAAAPPPTKPAVVTPTVVTRTAAAVIDVQLRRAMADEISDADDTYSQYDGSSVATDDRYNIRLSRSDAESTAYSSLYSDGYSESSRSYDSRSVGYAVDKKKTPVRKELHLPVPKEEDPDHSFEALEVQEEDFLKELPQEDVAKPVKKARRWQRNAPPVRATEDEVKYNEDDEEELTNLGKHDDDYQVHEADDEQDDDEDDDEDYSTDNGGESFASPDTSQANTLDEDDDDEDDDDDDDDEEEEASPIPSLGRELSEMAQELTRGGPAVLIDWLALRSTS